MENPFRAFYILCSADCKDIYVGMVGQKTVRKVERTQWQKIHQTLGHWVEPLRRTLKSTSARHMAQNVMYTFMASIAAHRWVMMPIEATTLFDLFRNEGK